MKAAFLQIVLFPLPWPLRRRLLNWLFGFRIHPEAKVGLSLLLVDRLSLDRQSKIGHLTIIKGLQSVVLDERASLGNLNWVTAVSIASKRHFTADVGRATQLHIEQHAAITHRHLIDCTNSVTIGAFSTFAGWGSQILTHAIDLQAGRQSSAPVRVGRYCFVGTRAVILKGAVLPDRSVLAAGSVLGKAMTEEDTIYNGVPAAPVRRIDPEGKYFTREVGFVE